MSAMILRYGFQKMALKRSKYLTGKVTQDDC